MKSELKRFYQRAAASLRTAKIAPPSAHKGRLLLTLLMMLLTAATGWADPTGNWADEGNRATTVPQSEDGSTLYISTAEQLACYAYGVNNDWETSGSAGSYYCSLTVELMADIDLSAHYWTPIGTNKNYYFNGFFHGNGHVISGMNIVLSSADGSLNTSDNFGNPCIGLFGHIRGRSYGTGTTSITDLTLKDFSVNITSNGTNPIYVGGLVGFCNNNSTTTSITNCCLINGTVSCDLVKNLSIGGLVASGTPTTCANNYRYNVSTTALGGNKVYGPISGESVANCATLTISSTHGSVAIGGSVGVITDGKIYAASGETVTLSDTPEAGYMVGYTASGVTITDGAFTMPANDDATVAATFSIDPDQFSQDGNTYTIHTAGGWGVFCDLIADGESFSGKTVQLGADITVSRMAGSSGHDFTGTFDGGSHTLTFNYTATDNYCAPFRHVQGATAETPAVIRNLNVVSTVTAADYRHPAGLIALQSGHVSVTDCNVEAHISNTTGTANPTNLYPAALVSQSNNTGVLTVSGCTTTGQIDTDGKYAAGLVGIVQNTATITNCRVSVTIQSTTSGDGTHGGLVASQSSGTTIAIEGCVFDGRLLGSTTIKCGGFIGWRGNTATISNSLFAPAEVTVQNDGSATFARNDVDTYNCYYTTLLNDGNDYVPAYVGGTETPNLWRNGKATRTVTAAADVTIGAIALTGTATQYTVSGITAYSGGGLQRGQTLYYGSGDQLSLTLSNSATGAPQGYQYAYTASAGTLSGSTLTMPDQDVTISVNTAALAPIDWATVNQGDSEEDPYMIYNKDQLLLLAHRVNGTNGESANTYLGKYFKLGADITFTHDANEGDDYAENYEAIGGYIGGTERLFKGNFDGDGHTVSGIRIRKTGSSSADIDQGLFGRIASGANIYDVHLTDARITGYYSVGGIAGFNAGTVSGCTVTDSYITAYNGNYGTICGFTNYGDRLTNNYYHGCTVNGTENATNVGCGGSEIADITANNGALPAYAITLGANITTPPGTFADQTGWLDTPPVNPRLAPENGFTLAGNHYFASGYEFTPGSTLASGAAQGYTPRATLGGQLLDPYTPSGDTDPLAGKAIARLTITADCDGKTLASTQAIYSTRQSVTVAYIKADGTAGEAIAIALDGTETTLAEGWYFVGKDISYNATLTLGGDVNLILADGCTMNIGTSGSRISGNGIAREDGGDQALTIYGQNAGTGALNVYTGGPNGILAKAVTINGGHVTIDANGNLATGIYAVKEDITINGGNVSVTATGTNAWAIYANCNLTINGGNVNATGGAEGIRTDNGDITINGGTVNASGTEYGINANYGSLNITLGWTNYSDRIYASSYSGTVSVKDGLAFVTDKATPAVIGGTISDLAAINGKTLKPATFYLVGNMTNPEWTVNADYQLTVNPGNTSELMIQNVPLTGSTEFKVVYSANGTESTTWYPGDGYNYWISADGIYDIYFRPDYQGGDDWHYGCIYATDVSNIEVAFAPEGFATYYHGTFDVKLPEGVKARIVTARGDSEGTLTYETIADGDTNDKVVPAGTAVMLQTEKSTEAQQKTLTLAVHGADSPAAPTLNLLHGSDVEGTTTGDGKHYKLTYGNDNTPNADVFGWYWGSADGAAFTSPAHKAWLVLPADANARSFFGLPDDDTTGIVNAEANSSLFTLHSSLSEWYTIDGMKLSGKPTAKGVYILNGRKIVIK